MKTCVPLVFALIIRVSSLAAPALNSQETGPFGTPAVGLGRLPLPGDVLWRSEIHADSTSASAVGRDGTMYFPGRDHRLYAFSSDFTLRWTYPPSGEAIGRH